MTQIRKNGLQQYGQVAATSEVDYANPHRLVQMLLEGALDKIAAAKGLVDRRDFAGKSRYISWAVSIINGLRNSLDLDAGGEMAANLDNLYEYMGRRLFEANSSNTIEPLNEVSSLLLEVKSAWDALPDSVKTPVVETQQQVRPALR